MKKIFLLSKNKLLTKLLTSGAEAKEIPFYSLNEMSELNFRIEDERPDYLIVDCSSYNDSDIRQIDVSVSVILLVTNEEKKRFQETGISHKMVLKPIPVGDWYHYLMKDECGTA